MKQPKYYRVSTVKKKKWTNQSTATLRVVAITHWLFLYIEIALYHEIKILIGFGVSVIQTQTLHTTTINFTNWPNRIPHNQ